MEGQSVEELVLNLCVVHVQHQTLQGVCLVQDDEELLFFDHVAAVELEAHYAFIYCVDVNNL